MRSRWVLESSFYRGKISFPYLSSTFKFKSKLPFCKIQIRGTELCLVKGNDVSEVLQLCPTDGTFISVQEKLTITTVPEKKSFLGVRYINFESITIFHSMNY